jgi:hypothetical protein
MNNCQFVGKKNNSKYKIQCRLVKLPFPLRQLVWSRYLERERGSKGEALKKFA